jgi:antirestriction protein ArdC
LVKYSIALSSSKRAIVVAAAQAEKAADYILGHKEVPVIEG